MAILNYTTPPKPKPTPKVEEPKAKKDEPIKGTGLTNFCKLGAMSTCGVTTGKKWKDHVDCKFAIKSLRSDRCTDLRFEEYCTCLKAQMAAEEFKWPNKGK